MGAVVSFLPGNSVLNELLETWAWLLLLRLASWAWPIEVHHHWTETEALMLLRLPAGYPEASLRLMHLTDAHISESPLEPRERRHGERMHAAFAAVPSRANGSSVRPASVFRELVDLAALAGVDTMVLSGDILNFPQARTATWVAQTLNGSLRHRQNARSRRGPKIGDRIPFLYCAGNHDWFYEGSAEGQRELQLAWRQTALHPLYAQSAAWDAGSTGSGGYFDGGAYEAGGLLFVTLDNSRHQVTPRQLAFFRAQVLRWIPTVLVLHVPLSVADSLRPYRGYALCGDPAWGEAVDHAWRVERRRPWPRTGNSHATERLLEAVLNAAAPRGPLVAVLAGHVHAHDATAFGRGGHFRGEAGGSGIARGAVQYIGLPAFDGGHRLISAWTEPLRSAGALEGGWRGGGQAGRSDDARLLLERQRALQFLRGLTSTATGNELHDRGSILWQCWGGMAGAAAAAALLDMSGVELALLTMLRRTQSSMRQGFAALAKVLLPLLERAGETAGGGGPGSECALEVLHPLLHDALPAWADLRRLVYEPGRMLELQDGCSVLEPLNEAVGAWKRDGDWEGLGAGLGAVLRAGVCWDVPQEAGA